MDLVKFKGGKLPEIQYERLKIFKKWGIPVNKYYSKCYGIKNY